jgi:hypothetical protein
MSATTIAQSSSTDLTNPDSYLDAKSGAVLAAQGKEGIGGFVFDVPTGEEIELDADITDHYVESGSFVTDHVVLKPIIITLSGYKGELVYTAPKKGGLQDAMNVATSLLGSVGAYGIPYTAQAAGKLSALTAQVGYAAGQVEAMKKRASNLAKYFGGDDSSPNLQTKALVTLQAMWDSKQILTIQTPWGFYNNMIIKSVRPKQDAESNDYTDFTVTLKEMRFVSTKTTTFDSGTYTSAIDAQKAEAAKDGASGTGKGPSQLKTTFAADSASVDSLGKIIPPGS